MPDLCPNEGHLISNKTKIHGIIIDFFQPGSTKPGHWELPRGTTSCRGGGKERCGELLLFCSLLSFCHFVGAFFVSVCFCENCYWYLKVIKAKVKVQLYLRVILFESDQVSNYKAWWQQIAGDELPPLDHGPDGSLLPRKAVHELARPSHRQVKS